MDGAASSARPSDIELWTTSGLVDYPEAVATMEARVAAIRTGEAAEGVWFLEHPPLYTSGTSARPEDLLDPRRLPVFATGRGGQYTYHGPGQRIAYVMLDLKRGHGSPAGAPSRGPNVRRFVHLLEEWVIRALSRLGVKGERREGRIGIWVEDRAKGPGREAKIAAIGVRVRHWVSYHGLALNVDPELAHFQGIVPCGIAEHGVTSLRALGSEASMADVDAALIATFAEVFGTALARAHNHAHI